MEKKEDFAFEIFELLKDLILSEEKHSKWAHRGASVGISLPFVGECNSKVLEILAPIANSSKITSVRSGSVIAHSLLFQGFEEEGLPLLKSFISDEDNDVRLATIIGLGLLFFGLNKGLSLFESLLEEKDGKIKRNVGISIGLAFFGSGDLDAINVLKQLLEDGDPYVREGAIIGLGMVLNRFEDKATLRFLKNMIVKEEDGNIRRLATFSMALLFEGRGDIDVLEELVNILEKREDDYLFEGAVLGTGTLFHGTKDSQALTLLESLISDEDPFIRRSAVIGISLILHGSADISGLRILKPLVYDPDINVARFAVLSIGIVFQGTGDYRAFQILKAILEEKELKPFKEIRHDSIIAIGLLFQGIKDESVIKFLDKNLREKDWFLLEGTAISLGLLGSKKGFIPLGVLRDFGLALWPELYTINIAKTEVKGEVILAPKPLIDPLLNYLADLLNLNHILIIIKDTGINVFEKNFRGGIEQPVLVSGLISALTNFLQEIREDSKKDITKDLLMPWRELGEAGGYIGIVEGKLTLTAVFSKIRIQSNEFKERLREFVRLFEDRFQPRLISFLGDLRVFDPAFTLMEEQLHVDYLFPHHFNSAKFLAEHLLEETLNVGQIIREYSSELGPDNTFYLEEIILRAISTLRKTTYEEVLKAIIELRDKNILIPVPKT